jgi:peptide/nickel transport system permease protein
MLSTVILRRLLFSIPTIVGVATLAFVLGHLAPGDPAIAAMGLDMDGFTSVDPAELERVRRELGLDRSLLVQYGMWFGKAIQGDFGRSYVSNEYVAEMIFRAIPTTVFLLVTTMTVAAIVGITLGVISAVNQGKTSDYISRMITIIGVSTPTFWFALVLILLFSFAIPIFPMSGNVADHGPIAMILPTMAIALHPAALIARMMRSTMLEILSQDMVRTATAKGLSRQRVLWVHALRNAINPVITVIGFQFANLMGGAVAVEYVFAMPGLGSLLIESIHDKDLLVMQGAVLIVGVAFAVTNLVVDILYMVIDPRIRL